MLSGAGEGSVQHGLAPAKLGQGISRSAQWSPDLRQRLAVGLDVVSPPQDHGHCLGPHAAILLLLHL